jgi:hypothetical protein
MRVVTAVLCPGVMNDLISLRSAGYIWVLDLPLARWFMK